MNYLEQEDTSMSSSEVIYAHQNEKKKFVCARIRVVINKTFLLFSQHPKRVITPLKKKSNETEQNYCVLLSNAFYKTRSLSKSVL